MSDQDEPEQVETPEQDESPLDVMRDSGVGLSDPNIVGDPEPGLVDAEFSDDEPQV
jgi:hypothetical protein